MEVALVPIAAVLAIVFVIVSLVTLPFGFYRAYTRKLSLRWFLAIHVPVPFVFLTRWEAGLSLWFIFFTFGTCITAQVLGSRIGRWWIGRRPVARVADDPKILLPQSCSHEG